MPYFIDAAGRSRLSPEPAPDALDSLDRILLGVCAAIWLAALGAGVAATVALVELGRGHPTTPDESDTPWLLYAVIGISAAVIIGAVPLLLRARRTALDEPRPARTTGGRPTPRPPPVPGAEAPTEKFRALKTVAEQVNPRPGYPAPQTVVSAAPSHLSSAVDQLWLRCAVLIALAMGIVMLAIGVATYLMASDQNSAAWIVYCLAGLVTLAMPAIPWFYLRQLRDVVDTV